MFDRAMLQLADLPIRTNLRDWRPNGRIAYGGDYSPEQWDKSVWPLDVQLMQEAAVNFLTPAVFSWAELEVAEGEFDFAWLHEVLDGLAAGGMYLDLATATASPPVWMARNYPDSLPVYADGIRRNFGSRQQYCPSSPDFRRLALRLITKMAQEFGDHPALRLWHVSNEYGCHTFECYCPRCVAGFQAYLEDRYQNIEQLNAAWCTRFWSQRYSSFAEINAPVHLATIHNPGQVTDWRRFHNHLLLSLYAAEAAVLRVLTPQIPVTTNFMGDYGGLNYADWAPYVDVVADDSYPDPADPAACVTVGYVSDLMRSLGTERVNQRDSEGYLVPNPRSFLLLEQTPSAVQWRGRNSVKRPGQLELWSWQRWAQGADGIMHFQWRQSLGGAESLHGAMVSHAGKASRTWKEVVQLGHDLRKAPVYGERSWPIAQVALVMDWDSEWIRQAAVGPVQVDWLRELRAWYRTFFEAGYSVDMVRPHTRLDGYKVIVVPALWAVEQKFADNLQAALEAGAQVLVVAPTGVVNRDGHAYLGGYLGPLQELLGVRVLDHACATGQQAVGEFFYADAALDAGEYPEAAHLSSVVGVPAASEYCELKIQAPANSVLRKSLAKMAGIYADNCVLRGGIWAEEIEPFLPVDYANQRLDKGNDAPAYLEIWAKFTPAGNGKDLAGRPALTKCIYASGGAAWYLGTDLDLPSRASLGAQLVADASLQLPIEDLPAGVQAVQRPDGILVLLNHGDQLQDLGGILETAGFTGTCLLTGQTARELKIAPRSVVIISS